MSIGVGVVGSGFMGRTWSAVAATCLPGARLAGIAGGTRAPEVAAEFGCRLFSSVPQLLADPEVHIVVVASPPAAHRDQVLAAARAGKHVLVEKPMAQDPGECAEMVAACDEAGVRLAVVSQQRFRHVPATARRLVEEGAIGRVTMVRALGPEVGFWDTAKTRDAWKLDPAQQTAYASWGAHACDLLRWLSGAEAEVVFALFGEFSSQPPPMRSAMVTYGLTGGAMAQVWMSYDIPPPGLGGGLQFLVVGTTGMLEFDAYGALRLARDGAWSTVTRQPDFDATNPRDPVRLGAYAAQLGDLLEAVTQGRPPAVTGSDGLLTTRMLSGAERSAQRGASVLLRNVSVSDS
ncbi:Gfo/Idh/MocA family oxidoreductase [Dactylosporangium sp. NPDC005572]|uniref:Gfo/Idh/MocA family protein n=1 Tax=Dactylosporangium sp. NPDC005572 TaxID=3156889 RepID=UPI0033A9F4A8